MTKATSVRLRDERSASRVAAHCAVLAMGWVSAMLALGPTAALADCRHVGGSNFLCSGATSAPQIISLDDATVVTAPGFGVAVPPSYTAMLIEGSGALSYLDIHGAVLSGPLLVENTGGVGTVSIVSNGTFGGVAAYNDGPGATTITLTGAVNGEDFGIFALNDKGAINVSASGAVRTQGLVGMLLAAPGDIAAAVADVYGTDVGLMVATGDGAVTIASSGTITGANGVGVLAAIADTASASDMVFDLHSVIGATMGVAAINDGTGATRITVNGLVEGMTGILTQSHSGGAAEITNNGHVRSTDGVMGLAVDTEHTQPTMLVNNGQLTGTVDLSGFDDVFTNAGVWSVGGGSEFKGGYDRLINQTGAIIVAAHDADLTEIAVLWDLEELSGGGTVSLRDGGGGDFLIVEGSASFAPGAIHALDIGADADWILFGGTADITGTELHVKLLADTMIGETFTVLRTLSGLNGTYASVDGNTAYLGIIDTYDANNAYVQVVQHTGISVPARTPNQRATAAALESLALSNPVVMGLLVAPDDRAARMVLDNLSGDLHASLQSMLLEDSRLVRDAILAQLRASFAAPVGAVPALSYVAGEIALDWPQTQLWAQAYGNWDRIDSDGNAGTMTAAAGGGLIGADALVEDWRLGLMFGFERSSMSVAGRVGQADVASYHAALYGGTEWGDVAFRTGLAYEWNAISTRRDTTLTAEYAGSLLQGFGELAYGIDAGSVAFEPYVNLALVGAQTDGFTEQGGPAALTVQAANAVAAFAALGVRASTQFIIGDTTLVTATGGVAWRQGFGATPVVQSNFAGSTGFTIAGAPFAGGAVLLDAGLEFDLSEQARFGVSYDSVIGANQLAQRIEASFALRF